MNAPANDGGVQGVYDFWLGLIPQFFGQLGAAIPAGGGNAASPAPGLSFPADQVARAASLMQDALQGIARAYTPMLQAAGAPGLLGQWATTMPFFSTAANGGGAAVPPGMFNPWAAAMSFMPAGQGNAAAAAPAAQWPLNPWAAAMTLFPGAQSQIVESAKAAAGTMDLPGAWIALLPYLTGAPTAAGDFGRTVANVGMMPWQAMQQAWRDVGAQAAGAMPQAFASGFDRTFGALSDALGFGPVRKLQAALQDLVGASVAQNQARANYAMLVQSAFAAGLEGLLKRLAAMAEAGERVDSVLALLRLWAVHTEQAVHEVLQSEEGLAATAAVARAGLAHRRHLQHMAGIVADGLDMATRRDLDEAFREIQELKRELRRLRPPVKAGAGTRKPSVDAKKRSPR
jgi:hypothetical protein